MNLKNLNLKNFRGFTDKEIVFNKQFNVLIGDNGSGKTTVLDALAISLSTYYLGVDSNYSKSILDKDIRINIFSESLEFQLPTEIKVTGEIDNEQFTWIRDRSTRKGITRQSGDTRSIIQIAKSHQNKVRNNEDVTLPLLSYYGTSRLWKEKKSIIKTSPKSII